MLRFNRNRLYRTEKEKKMKRFCYLFIFIFVFAVSAPAVESLKCWFPPAWSAKTAQAEEITGALQTISGIGVTPQIADSYPQILNALHSDTPCMVYAGSFVQSIIYMQQLGEPLVFNLNGRELYSGVMIHTQGKNPKTILEQQPESIAYTVAATSGESSAKAATGGRADLPFPSHRKTAEAVASGRAAAGFVKNFWWSDHKSEFPQLTAYEVPGISRRRNPDNILTVSSEVPEPVRNRISEAAKAGKRAFGSRKMIPLNVNYLQFSIQLMRRGGIDPTTYEWETGKPDA
jgi:ABC-type phosphate/phosphonate transport system substrate-binding protein